MARHGPLKKPSMAQMPVLLFMADHRELLLVSHSVMNSTGYRFAYRNGQTYRDASDFNDHLYTETENKPEWCSNDPKPDIPKNLAIHRWLQSGWLSKFNRGPSRNDDKDNPDNHWAWYDHPYRLTNEGKAMAEKWRAAYEEHAAKQEEKRKQVERYIVVSNTGRWAMRDDKRKYAALCRVVGETEKRLYVERVFTEDEKNAGRYLSGYMPSIQGTKKKYVERDVVTADGVTIEEYRAMRRVETANMAWLKDLKEQEQAEIDEIRDRYDSRREQNDAMFQDELREALEQVRKS